MNRLLILLLLAFNLSCFSQSQSKLNEDAKTEYEKADTELNSVYKNILTQYKMDTIFIDRLKKAQRIWIKYRDAELEMKYPTDNKQLVYGSVYPMCVSLFLKELTEQRTERLKIWLNGIQEGEVCIGSVKMN